jgi:DNA (cytosine-5)-methyltransferase 1
MIRVVDIFAGPGGLGEGFASARRPGGGSAFETVLSVEKDYRAMQTLGLRTFFRRFAGRYGGTRFSRREESL